VRLGGSQFKANLNKKFKKSHLQNNQSKNGLEVWLQVAKYLLCKCEASPKFKPVPPPQKKSLSYIKERRFSYENLRR
jgi:hypothetical protein